MWKQSIKRLGAAGTILAGLLGLCAGCANQELPASGRTEHLVNNECVLVDAGSGDTLESLARRYYHDPGQAWRIARFNQIQSVRPGQAVLIPLRPTEHGGLTPEGYQSVPVLAYMKLAPDRTDKLIVSKTNFARQMQYLNDNGYRPITLDQFKAFMNLAGVIPPKAVVITFDNGWRSVYDIAYPILRRYGFPATVFVYTDFIGAKKALSWEQIRAMTSNGIAIQSQTVSFCNLTRMGSGQTFAAYLSALEHELVRSRKRIEARTRQPCRYLAYPYGETNGLVIAMLKKHGYQAGFTLKRGSNPFFVHDYRVRRSLIYGHYDLQQFRANLKTFHPAKLQ